MGAYSACEVGVGAVPDEIVKFAAERECPVGCGRIGLTTEFELACGGEVDVGREGGAVSGVGSGLKHLHVSVAPSAGSGTDKLKLLDGSGCNLA